MFEILKPFFHLLTRKKFILSRWIIWKTLGRLACLKRLHTAKSPVTIQFGKYKITAPDYNILSILLKEKFVYNEYYFAVNKEAPVIIDGGSNIGISVLYFKYLYPNAIIHCFEPYSKAYDYLEKNIRQNHLEHVHLNKLALSNVQQSVDLFIPETGGMINGTVSPGNGEQSERVEAIKLSDYISTFPVVDLIKLDVEASEVAILNDLNRNGSFVKNNIENLVVEFHATVMDDEDASQKFTKLLASHAYRVDARAIHAGKAKSDLIISAHRSKT